MFKKLLLIAFIGLLPTGRLWAQVINTGEIISVSANGLLFIGDSYTHQNGFVLNNGELNLTGNWANNSQTLVFDTKSSGTVHFSGGKQLIGGSFRSGFPSVELSGSAHKALNIDADVAGILTLNNIELKLNQYALNISNVNTAAIVRTSGFISTDKKGKLYRSTSSAGPYLFPFGSSAFGPAIYRPVSIEPQSTPGSSYSGTFYYQDPSMEGYDRNAKRPDIDKIFEKYFYVLSHDSGTGAAKLKFYQNTADGDYLQLIKWTGTRLWEKAMPAALAEGAFGDGLNRNLMFTSAADGFKDQAFSFSNTTAIADPLTLFNAFSPDGDGKNDTWLIKNLDQYPNNELMIFNRWGDEVFKAKSYNSSKAWDGANLQAGTYFYVLNVEINGQKKVYKGFISMAKN